MSNVLTQTLTDLQVALDFQGASTLDLDTDSAVVNLRDELGHLLASYGTESHLPLAPHQHGFEVGAYAGVLSTSVGDGVFQLDTKGRFTRGQR